MKPYCFIKYCTRIILVVSCVAFLCACSSDDPGEPTKEVQGGVNEDPDAPSITIYADGTTSTGAEFLRVSDTEIYIDGVGYMISDKASSAKVIGRFVNTVIVNLEPYAKITINDNTYTVRSIAPYAFYTDEYIQYVKIPNSITTIDIGAFQYSSLKKVVLSSSVRTIEDFAFSGCELLTDINFPNSLFRIGHYAFNRTESLEDVILNDGLEEIGEHCFVVSGPSRHMRVIVKAPVSVISYSAFECGYLELPSTITEIRSGNSSRELKCYATTPPKLEESHFDKLYVPESALSEYQKEPWLSACGEIIGFNPDEDK